MVNPGLDWLGGLGVVNNQGFKSPNQSNPLRGCPKVGGLEVDLVFIPAWFALALSQLPELSTDLDMK